MPEPHTDHQPPVKLTRRRLLEGAAGMTAAALASSLMPPNIRRVLADPPPIGSLRDVKHVVLLMQENRSFDHYFGTMSGVRGFADPNAMKLSNGQSVFFQPDAESASGYLAPFRLDTGSTSAQRIPSTSHAWSVQHESWNGGLMDRWLPAHRKADGKDGPFVMGYHTRADIPFQFALAEAFTVCDEYYCSVFGPTWPNRMYWMTGTVDAQGQHGGPLIDNSLPKTGRGLFTWKTYAERLEEAGISWKVYQQKDNYGCNMLETFQAFQDAPEGSSLRKRGMTIGAPEQFEEDAKNDRLPAVSWIIPTSYESEHPDYTPAEGAAFVARQINAIAANPEVWAKTVFILNYDENDGLFDHVSPPVPAPGTPDEFVGGLPIGAGFRVPCIIVSPWTAGGWVCSEVMDHTSPLRFLETFAGVREPNISNWRRKTFGDMTSAFRFYAALGKPPKLPDASSALEVVKMNIDRLPKPTPLAESSLPVQEPGKRNRVPSENG